MTPLLVPGHRAPSLGFKVFSEQRGVQALGVQVHTFLWGNMRAASACDVGGADVGSVKLAQAGLHI